MVRPAPVQREGDGEQQEEGSDKESAAEVAGSEEYQRES